MSSVSALEACGWPCVMEQRRAIRPLSARPTFGFFFSLLPAATRREGQLAASAGETRQEGSSSTDPSKQSATCARATDDAAHDEQRSCGSTAVDWTDRHAMRRTAASTGAPNSASGSSSSSGSSAARAPMSFAPAAPSRSAAAIDPFAPRSRVAPSLASSSSAARSAASSAAAGVPARPARAPSASAAAASPVADDSDLDLEGLLGWDARRAADRARDERALRDRILARDREMRADRQRVQRLAGASSELSDMLAAMLARSSIGGGGGFGDEAGPALDPLTGLPQSMCVTLRCFSFAVADRPQLQGDKIILPGEALYQINRLRLPFPLLFRIEKMGADGEERKRSSAPAASVGAAGAGSAASSSSQYAGVLEFSAPAEQCFLPQWMMENLRVGEGDSVRVYSESHVPQARWVKLQPHSQSFSALLRELGPKYFLENAMRHYSVLTKGQRIMVTHAGQNHSLDVVDARPNDTVSLLGNLDLEVEFGPALDAPREERDAANTFRAHASGPAAGGALGPDPNLDDEDEQLKRALAMSLAESGLPPESPAAAAEPVQADASPVADDEGWAVAAPVVASAQPSGVSSLQARFGSGNRLGGPTVSGAPEAKYAEPAAVQPVAVPAPAVAAAAQPESKEDREGESDDDDDEGSDAEHDASPLAAVEVPPNHSLCPTCNRAIATSSFSLHTLHCARAFSKCAVCARMVKKTEAASHAAGHARVECPQCHVQLESRKLRRHVKRDCAYRPAACKWCAESTPLIKLPSHEAACGSLTQDCPVCEQPVPRRDMREHPSSEACRVQCAKCEEVIIARDIVAHTKDRCCQIQHPHSSVTHLRLCTLALARVVHVCAGKLLLICSSALFLLLFFLQPVAWSSAPTATCPSPRVRHRSTRSTAARARSPARSASATSNCETWRGTPIALARFRLSRPSPSLPLLPLLHERRRLWARRVRARPRGSTCCRPCWRAEPTWTPPSWLRCWPSPSSWRIPCPRRPRATLALPCPLRPRPSRRVRPLRRAPNNGAA